jgi:hypothetical protein
VFSPSRFEPKEDKFGKVISPLEDSKPYPEGAGEMRSSTPEPTGFSLVCYQSSDKVGSIKFLTKNGKVYNPETQEYMGELGDFQPEPPTKEQVDTAIEWARQKFKIT